MEEMLCVFFMLQMYVESAVDVFFVIDGKFVFVRSFLEPPPSASPFRLFQGSSVL